MSQDRAVETLSAVLSSSATGGNTAASGSSGMFKKRAKTSSAQKGLRKAVTSASAATPTINISDDDSDDEESDDGKNFKSSDVVAGRKRKRGFTQGVSSRKPTSKEDIGVSYDVSKNSEAFLDPKSQATAISAEFNDSELLGRAKSTTSVESTSDNLYRGQKAYKTLVPKREQISTKYNSMGPQKAASNVRMTTVTDYAPGMSFFSLN